MEINNEKFINKVNESNLSLKEMVQENEIDGFVHCLKVLGYKEI